MHRTVLNGLPEKNLKDIIKIVLKVLWHNYLYPKLARFKAKSTRVNPEAQRLHIEGHRLKGELALLENELEATPSIKGYILPRSQTSKVTGTTRNYNVLRWHEEGVRKEKYLVKVKKKDGDLTVEEARVLVNNAERSNNLKIQIKERKTQLHRIESKLTVLSGQTIKINEHSKQLIDKSLIGRDKELSTLQNYLIHNIPTLIIGEPGIGKSHLIKALLESQTHSYIWIENLKAARTVLVEQAITQLHKAGHLQLDEDNYSKGLTPEELKRCLKNKSITQLADIIKDSMMGHDYIVVIDSMAGLTQANQIIVDKMLDTHCPFFACTNQLKSTIELESIYRRFTKLELEPLKKKDLAEIIEKKITNVQVKEPWLRNKLKTKIANFANGNPGVADKMFQDAYKSSLSGGLSNNHIESIQVPELPRRYFDLTPLVIISIASFAVLRFIGIGTQDTFLYVVGGIAFVVFMAFGRIMMRAWRE